MPDIELSEVTRIALDGLKVNKDETYDSILNRLIDEHCKLLGLIL